MSLRGILLLCFFIPSIPVCFMRPFYGLILWTIVAFTSLHKYTYGESAFLPWAMMVGVPTILGFAFFSRGWDRIKSRETIVILILWTWFVITTIGSTRTPLFVHHAADTWDHLETVSKILLMTLITMGLLDSFKRLRATVIVIASCFGFFVFKCFPFLIATSGNDRVYGPPNSMIGDNNDFGLALNMTLPFFFFLARTETNPKLKRLFGVLFILTIPTIFFTYSRGAMLGLIAVMGMMLLQSKQKRLLIPVVLLGVSIAVLFAPQAWKDRMNPTGDQALDKSAQSRINAWTFAWNLAADYPVAGGGFATFTRPLFVRYAPNPGDLHGPHSIYFGILAEHGFTGLFLYLLLIASAFYSTSQVIRWSKTMGDEVAAQYARMFRFSMVGFLVSGFFLGRQYFDYLYTIIACIAVLKRLCFDAWARQELVTGTPVAGSDEDEDVEEEPVGVPGLPGTLSAGAR